ncbi:tyrosine decarboxylase 1 [Selaginella moellendorffii]|uniref:tyrosine decarboxylase 1 n=1 Tax=Selaginella moellendorffii TaxID=88036 RepID=UPI000D1CC878|nr:tyrosine decarboxylase 1 [Selaginella moellendorffii]|eukprot:XP_024528821.1 tyrosine decarboxylase 1 [Selaginella moellendorffii]
MGESAPPPGLKLMDSEEFREHAHRMVDFVADYYRHIEKFPVRSQVSPGYLNDLIPAFAPQDPESFDDILADVSNIIIPGLTHWQSPSFFSYYPANSSTAGILAEILISGFNTVNFSWIASPAATELEIIVVNWLGKLLELPDSFLSGSSGEGGGVIQGSATEGMLVTLCAARSRAISKHTPNGLVEEDVVRRLRAYTSDQTHMCLHKACKIAGIKLVVLPTTKETNYALSPALLRGAIEEGGDDVIPLYLGATLGTTSSAAVDPLLDLGEIAQEYGMWFHVDAAYGGSACICPEYRHFLDGIEKADSLNVGTHKWLLTNLDCSVLWVKNARTLTSTLSVQSEYLRNKASEAGEVVDFKDWQVSLGKRFRSLKLWLVMRLYGSSKLKNYIIHHACLARLFERKVSEDKRFEVLVPCRFGLVCFRLKAIEASSVNALNENLLHAVNSNETTFITHTVLSGDFLLRMAVGGTLTEAKHVIKAWETIQKKATLLLSSK